MSRRPIDWLAVHWVCQGTYMALTPAEKRMVVRRLEHRMFDRAECWTMSNAGNVTVSQLADRLRMSERSVQRMRDQLPKATERVCPSCYQRMWIRHLDGVIEEHPTSLNRSCRMSGREMLTGLAAIRPELYPWIDAFAPEMDEETAS